MIQLTRIYIGLFIMFLASGCGFNNGCDVHEIYVGQSLLDSARGAGLNYCTELENALNGNQSSFRQLVTYLPGGAIDYDHGIVLIQLLCRSEEKNVLELFSTLSEQDGELLSSLLLVGVEYGDKSFNCPSIKIYVERLSKS